MGKVISNDLDTLVGSGYLRISLGLKPSGRLHLGNAITFIQAALAASSKEGAYIDAMVMDLDLNLQQGRVFVPYISRKDPDGCHELMRQHTFDETTSMLEEFSAFFGNKVDFKLTYFSEFAKRQEWKDLMSNLYLSDAGRSLLNRTINHDNNSTFRLLGPICPCCGNSGVGKPHYEGGSEVSFECRNTSCNQGEFKVDILEPGKVNVFYLVDPARDLIADEDGKKVDLHVFGGDYGVPYGNGNASKAQRVHGLLSGLSDLTPDIYVGPKILMGRRKLAKSSLMSFAVEQVKDKFPNWVERLYSTVVDYQGQPSIQMDSVSHFK